MRICLPASLLGLLMLQGPGGVPALPAALVLSGATAGFSAPAEARPRSSGGYSRPGGASRTPSTSGSGSYSRPRTPSSGGYSRPGGGGLAVPYGGGTSAGDRGYSRAQSADALRRMRESQAASERAARTAPMPSPARQPGEFGIPGGGGYGGGGYRTAPGAAYGGWYRDRGWSVPGPVLSGPRSFGIWDAAFMWFLFSTLNRPGHADFFRNHQDDPGYREWRQDAERRAQSDAEVRARLDELDRNLAAGRDQPRNPNYLPPGVPPEVATGGADAGLPDRRTPSAAPAGEDGRGGIPVSVGGVVLVGGGLLALLAWRRRRAASSGGGSPGGAGGMGTGGTLPSVAGMLRHKASGADYAPSRFRVGMTLTLDPTPFLLAGSATHLAQPRHAGEMVSVEEVGRIGDPAGEGLVRLYLPDGRAMLQLHLRGDNEPDECRYFALLDEITPADEAEWGVWLDPQEGMVGWPEFQTQDGRLYARVWSPGSSRIPPRRLVEEVEAASGRRTVHSQAMLYAAPTGLAAPAPQTEYILVAAVEDGGQAWVEVRAGLDVNPASLSLA